jgi:hypothetical protein
MREVKQGRDRTLPPPRRVLGPGERMVSGRVLYSAAWLDAARGPILGPDTPGDEAGRVEAPQLARPVSSFHGGSRIATDSDMALRARARAAREVIRENPDVDRLDMLAEVLWPSPKLLAYYR